MEKQLAVFDFDHTMIDDNSDTAIITLIDKNSIPQEVKDLHRRDGWTAFMQGIFTLLHEKGINQDTITAHIANLPPVEGVPNLINELHKKGYHIIIISDCNSYFIKSWLKRYSLDKRVLKVFTNPSEFVDGVLKISMYHLQKTCKLSTKNLCKGQILEDFIEEQRRNGILYNRVIYCGDGVNDFCPILRLRQNDLACIRNNHKCMELVLKAKEGQSFDNTGNPHIVKAEVFIWDNGNDILKRVLK